MILGKKNKFPWNTGRYKEKLNPYIFISIPYLISHIIWGISYNNENVVLEYLLVLNINPKLLWSWLASNLKRNSTGEVSNLCCTILSVLYKRCEELKIADINSFLIYKVIYMKYSIKLYLSEDANCILAMLTFTYNLDIRKEIFL